LIGADGGDESGERWTVVLHHDILAGLDGERDRCRQLAIGMGGGGEHGEDGNDEKPHGNAL